LVTAWLIVNPSSSVRSPDEERIGPACGRMMVVTGPCGAVLCDVDGVIRHWDRAATARLEQEYDLPVGTMAAVAFAQERLAPAITGQVSDGTWRAEIVRDLTALCRSASRAAEIVGEWSSMAGRADAEVLELLRQAREHVPVALVSNATTRLEEDLRRLGVTRVIDVVVSSARVGVTKPQPGIYVAAAARVGVPVNRCLFVDDTPGHVRAATALGMNGLVYRGPDGLRRALAPLFG
jgi:putative hydrolase of the HAD superfamily